MTEPALDCGYLSFSPELQAACEADYCRVCGNPKGPDCETAEFYADPANCEPVGPPRRRHGRTRIEIVADHLGRTAEIDYDADMAYIEVREGVVARTDVKLEDQGLILDYDENGELLGVEVFLVQAAVHPETVAALVRLLRGKS